MEYYLSFSVIIIFFQLCVDIFIHGVLELFHGWKIHDYLVRTIRELDLVHHFMGPTRRLLNVSERKSVPRQ